MMQGPKEFREGMTLRAVGILGEVEVGPTHIGSANRVNAASSPSWLPLSGNASKTVTLPSPFVTKRSPGGGAGSKCHRRNCGLRARSGANRCFYCGKSHCPEHSSLFTGHELKCSHKPQDVEPLSASGSSDKQRAADRHAEDSMNQDTQVKLSRRMRQILAAEGQGLYTLLEVVARLRAVTFDMAKECGLFENILVISSEAKNAQMAHLATTTLLKWFV
jgi:hypothetical protein